MECSEYGMGVYNLFDFSRAWFFSYYNVYGSEHDNGNTFGEVRPRHWSEDGKYLYFAPFFFGDGGCAIYYEALGLLRLDLYSGEFVEILSPDETWYTYNLTFSNDDNDWGYIETWNQPPILKLTNLATQTQEEIPLGENYSGAGNLIWSQDNTQIIYSARSGEDCVEMTYYLVLMDVKNQTSKIILEGQWADPYKPVQWVDEDRVIVVEWFSEASFTLDLITGELLPYQPPEPDANP